MSDVFRKVGRGGAGNFYSKKDVEDVEKAKPENVEAQKDAAAAATTTTTSPTSSSNGSAYARAGRGGAGNFYDHSSLPDSKQQEEAAGKTQAAVNASLARSARGATGRGGAGNYGDSTVPGSETAEDEVKRKEALEKKIIEDVEAGLPMPPKTYYHQSTKESKEVA